MNLESLYMCSTISVYLKVILFIIFIYFINECNFRRNKKETKEKNMKSVTDNNLNRNLSSQNKTYKQFKSKPTIEKSEVMEALEKWGEGLLSISRAHATQEDYISVAKRMLEGVYAFKEGDILFKPTLASVNPFRTTFESALSYFIGGNDKFSEDRGFALNSWVNVKFEIAGIITSEKQALVMGNKILKQLNGNITVANFTMGFIRSSNGELKINLHHSSLPYTPS